MCSMRKDEISKITPKIQTVGINLSLMYSLINFLENGLLDNINVSKIDTSNIVIVLRRLISLIIEDYSDIEALIED